KVIYFPLGTANDFARSLSLNPIQPEVSIVKDIVNNSPTVTIPIMSCNSKNFINVATGGALALITESGSDILKNVTGKLSYYVGALDEILSPQEYEITFKTKSSNKRVILTNGFIISQGLYAGGGVKVSPHISPLFKETFNFLTLESKELASSLADILKIQQSDSITDLKESKIITEDLEELIIQSETELPLKLDGEEYTSKKLKFSKSGKELKFYLY
ncbi:diacylglycerol kinase family protein, partial [Halobacteriovorax sp.]|uniref:diacylglycerol/lipid kinase family protein n=1 Tax=Halobacteriovorax sp. TaxID=2020862 RepID=UPI003568E413